MSMPKLSKGYSQYGASMGRRAVRELPSDSGARMRLAEVRLDSGGYDPGGAYWGRGLPLYRVWAYDADGFMAVDYFLRATGREHAKAVVRQTYPNARFYR